MERLNTVINESRKFYYKLLTDNDNLLTREIALVAGEKVSGLLPFSIITKESGVELRYEISALAKFDDYIKNIKEENIFLNLVNQIIDTLFNMNKHNLLIGKIIFDTRQVLINIYSSQIYFIYIPIDNYNAGYSFPDFLLTMLTQSDLDANGTFYKNYMNYLNMRRSQIDLMELKNYLKTLAPQVGAVAADSNNLETMSSIISDTNDSKQVGQNSVPVDLTNIRTIGMSNTRKLN